MTSSAAQKPSPGPVHIATITKNKQEAVQIALTEYRGFQLIDVRVFSFLRGDELQPTSKGVSLQIARLPALIAALQAAEAKARDLGLLDERGHDES